MAIARSFRELNVYKLARQEAGKMLLLTRMMDRADDFCKLPPNHTGPTRPSSR
ncbi:MAG: hypothetical protein QOJ40_207 [Verrucomicrobiota bacterium]